MSPIVEEKPNLEPAEAAAPYLDDRTRFIVSTLNEVFGERGWRVNEDQRYIGELRGATLAIDIVLPIERHAEAIDKAAAVELRILDAVNTRITLFVVAPEQ